MNNTEIGINQLKRRDFLRAGLVFGAGAAGLAAGYAAVPDAFARAVYAAKQNGVANDNVLVMIQLAGGNDGLRTLVPLTDPTLHDLRPKLAGPMVSQALPLTTDYGLNHNLGGIKGLWDKGKVAIVQGVGYPNPTFSHFESIRIWETGDPTRRQVDGWLGRTLAKAYDSNGHPLTGCACGATDVPGALRDLQATMTVIQNQKNFGFTGGSEVEAAVGALYKGTPGIYGALLTPPSRPRTTRLRPCAHRRRPTSRWRTTRTRSSSSIRRRTSLRRRCSWRPSSSSQEQGSSFCTSRSAVLTRITPSSTGTTT